LYPSNFYTTHSHKVDYYIYTKSLISHTYQNPNLYIKYFTMIKLLPSLVKKCTIRVCVFKKRHYNVMNNKVHLIILIVALVKNFINVIAILFVSNDYTIMRIIMQVVLPKHQETWVFPRFSVLLLQRRKMLNIMRCVPIYTDYKFYFIHTCTIKIVWFDVTIFIFCSLLECFSK